MIYLIGFSLLGFWTIFIWSPLAGKSRRLDKLCHHVSTAAAIAHAIEGTVAVLLQQGFRSRAEILSLLGVCGTTSPSEGEVPVTSTTVRSEISESCQDGLL